MSGSGQRFVAVIALTLLGSGIIGFMVFAIVRDGALSVDDGGWVTAAFLSLREVFSKIEKIVLARGADA